MARHIAWLPVQVVEGPRRSAELGFDQILAKFPYCMPILQTKICAALFEENRPIYTTLTMPGEAAQDLINRLKALVGKDRGSQSELTCKLGVPKLRQNDWLNLKSTPRLDDGLKIQAFLQIPHEQKALRRVTSQHSTFKQSVGTFSVFSCFLNLVMATLTAGYWVWPYGRRVGVGVIAIWRTIPRKG